MQDPASDEKKRNHRRSPGEFISIGDSFTCSTRLRRGETPAMQREPKEGRNRDAGTFDSAVRLARREQAAKERGWTCRPPSVSLSTPCGAGKLTPVRDLSSFLQASFPPTGILRRASPAVAVAGDIGNALSRRSFPAWDEPAGPPAPVPAPTAAPGPYDRSALRARMSMIGPSRRVNAFSPRVATRSRPSPGLARTVAARGAELIRASSANQLLPEEIRSLGHVDRAGGGGE